EVVVGEGDDPALHATEVSHPNGGDLGEPDAERFRERADAIPNRLDADAQRVVDGGAKSELPCEVRFPELEPLCVITNLVRVPVDPARAVQIGGRHLEPVQKLASYIQEAGTARAAEVLPAGRREHIALQARHAQRQLAGG